ncbi:unnamed protein product, partial [Sphacelaria rigidula]
ESARKRAQEGLPPLHASQETTSTASLTAHLFLSKGPSDTLHPFPGMVDQAFGSRRPTKGESHRKLTDDSSIDLAVVKRRAPTSAPTAVIRDGGGMAVGSASAWHESNLSANVDTRMAALARRRWQARCRRVADNDHGRSAHLRKGQRGLGAGRGKASEVKDYRSCGEAAILSEEAAPASVEYEAVRREILREREAISRRTQQQLRDLEAEGEENRGGRGVANDVEGKLDGDVDKHCSSTGEPHEEEEGYSSFGSRFSDGDGENVSPESPHQLQANDWTEDERNEGGLAAAKPPSPGLLVSAAGVRERREDGPNDEGSMHGDGDHGEVTLRLEASLIEELQ